MNLLLVNMIVRYDKIKSIALAQGNDFNFNISLTRRQIKLIKKSYYPNLVQNSGMVLHSI